MPGELALLEIGDKMRHPALPQTDNSQCILSVEYIVVTKVWPVVFKDIKTQKFRCLRSSGERTKRKIRCQQLRRSPSVEVSIDGAVKLVIPRKNFIKVQLDDVETELLPNETFSVVSW